MLVAAAIGAALSVLFLWPLRAQGIIQHAMYCDTSDQLKELIQGSTAKVVNTKYGDTACGSMEVVGDKFEPVEQVQVGRLVWQITRVHVTMQLVHVGESQALIPANQIFYAAFRLQGEGL